MDGMDMNGWGALWIKKKKRSQNIILKKDRERRRCGRALKKR